MLSVVVPCFNEAEVLPAFYDRLSAAAAEWDEPIELILVDDGSTDTTWLLIEQFAVHDPRVIGIRLARNFGHQAALGAGLHRARGDAVVVLDADLQDPPELVQEMLAMWRDGYDVVYAQRTRRHGESLTKKLLGHVFYRVLDRLNRFAIPRDTGDFALMDAKVVETLREFGEHALFWRGLRCWSGFRHGAVRFERPPRAAGETKYTMQKMVRLATDGLLSFSRAPLRFPFYAGLFLMAAVAVLSAVSTTAWLAGRAPLAPWWATAIGFIGAVQLVSVGVIGEYLARIYDEVRGRPRWIVRNVTESQPLYLQIPPGHNRIAG